jgi:hypothetical protein
MISLAPHRRPPFRSNRSAELLSSGAVAIGVGAAATANAVAIASTKAENGGILTTCSSPSALISEWRLGLQRAPGLATGRPREIQIEL